MDGAGAPRHGGAEGGGDVLGDAAAVVDEPGALGHGGADFDLIDFLEAEEAAFGEFAAAGDEDDGAFGGVDVGEAGDGVGEAGATGEHGDGGFASDAAPSVGHGHGCALVAGVDELDALIFGGVGQGEHGVTDDGEYLLDAFEFKAAYEQVGPGEVRHWSSYSQGVWCSLHVLRTKA